MRYSFRGVFFLGGLLAAAMVYVFSPSFGSIYIDPTYDREARSFAYFSPVDEVRMQAALLADSNHQSCYDQRLKLIPDIKIRTALEDYRRLHWDLG